VSTLPPLPPEVQAEADRNYADGLTMLGVAVAAAETDPKRDPDNDADYHNTIVAMHMKWTREMHDEGRGVYRMCAAAVIELNRLGWRHSTDLPGVDTEEPPKPKPRRRVDWRTVGFWAAMVYAASASVYGAYVLEQVR
jgi:hypothetical protein